MIFVVVVLLLLLLLFWGGGGVAGLLTKAVDFEFWLNLVCGEF